MKPKKISKQQLKQFDKLKPIPERYYWWCNKAEKEEWLQARNLNHWDAITAPIVTPLVGLIGVAVGLLFLMLTIKATAGIFATNKGLWIAGASVCMACGLGVSIWQIVEMAKKKLGFFIARHELTNENSIERHQSAIDEETYTVDEIAHDSASDTGVDEIE